MLPPEWSQNIRPKEKFPWSLIPWVSQETTITALWPHVYVPPEIYANLHSDEPNPWYLSMMAHEFTHIERERAMWVLPFFILYLVSAKFRIQEELIADEAAMKYLAEHGLEFDVEARAQMLSSWLYLHGISYEEAKKELRERWEKVKSFT